MASPLWKFFRRFDGYALHVGIDPGATGAVAFVFWGGNHDERLGYRVMDIPTLIVSRGKKKGTVFNLPGILNLFDSKWISKFRTRAWLEQPPPTLGPGRAYADIMLSRAYAIWPLWLTSRFPAFREIRPADWKKELRVGKEKEDSRHLALKLFPKADILRKKDHNRADALLISEYGRRQTGGLLSGRK